MGIKTLGQFEQIVLMALISLGANAYGMRVRQCISDRLRKDFAIGAVYTTLERLEKKGFVTSEVGESTKERGGRAKKYFRISASGRRALNNAQTDLKRMGAILPEGGLASV